MEKNIQPQFIVWPVIASVILLVGLGFLIAWAIIRHTAASRYAKRHADWKIKHDAWLEKRRAAQKDYEKANKGYSHFDGWSWENRQGNEEPREPRKSNLRWWEYDTFGTAAIILGIFLVIPLPAVLGVFAPYNAKYYTYDHVQGIITQINGASQPSGKYVVTNWVFKLEGKGFDERTLFTTDDERIQGYKAGDKVDLTCNYGYNPNGLDFADCQLRAVDGLQRQ